MSKKQNLKKHVTKKNIEPILEKLIGAIKNISGKVNEGDEIKKFRPI